MSASVLLIALVVASIGAWFVFRGESGQAPPGGVPSTASAPSTYRCKLCGATSPSYETAYEHASAEHDLAGHKIDESLEVG